MEDKNKVKHQLAGSEMSPNSPRRLLDIHIIYIIIIFPRSVKTLSASQGFPVF